MMEFTRLFLMEEFRMHTYYTNKRMFLAFPLIVFVFSFGIALTSDRILADTSIDEIMLLLHVSVFLYGLSVGAFGFMGREYVERQHGRRKYLVASPLTLPISFKKTFFGMYLRDVIFYLFLLLLPATLGLLLSVPFTGFMWTSIILLFIAALVSFLIGISLSFFASVVYIRSTPAFYAVIAVILGIFVGQVGLDVVPLTFLLPGLAMQHSFPPYSYVLTNELLLSALGGTLLIAFFVGAAYALIPTRFKPLRPKTERRDLPRTFDNLTFANRYRTLLAKELVDLRRSGTVTKMFFSFVTPLLFLSFTAWFVRTGLAIPVGFNTVFYGAMVGFFGVILYSWLNNVDVMEYFETLPVPPTDVIKTKIMAFLMLTSWISLIFLLAISFLNDDLSLLWLAIPVMFVVSIYMVVMTAYLTGLRTNTFLFDANILMKFTAMSMLPDVCLVIISFTIDRSLFFASIGILVVCSILILTTLILYTGIDEKWKRAEFTD
jgi:MFS family permease